MSKRQTIVGAINARHTELRKAVERCAKTQDDQVMANVERELRFATMHLNAMATEYEEYHPKKENA